MTQSDQAQASAILEAAVDGIIIIDVQGRIREFNRAAERIFGYSREEMVGENVSRLMPEPDRGHHDGYIEAYRRSHEPKIIGIGREVLGMRKDGTLFPMDLAVGEITGEGTPGFVGIIKDLTDRKAAEEKLEEGRRQLAVWWESAPIAKVVCDVDGRIIRANFAAAKFWQFELPDLVGTTIDRLVHAEDTERCLVNLAEHRGERTETSQLDLRFVDGKGETIYGSVHCSSRHVFDPGGGGRGKEIMLQIVDRTAEISAENEASLHRERLAHVTRLGTMAEMATGIAHEVNQPLTAISNYASACIRMLADEDVDPDLKDALAQIRDQAVRAGEVIRRLRSFIKKRESERELTAINPLIEDAVKLANSDSRLQDFGIVVKLGRNLPQSYMDPVQVQQVVLNLIRNGKEAMRGVAELHEPIEVHTSRNADGEIVVSVRDHGSGVSESDEDEIFNPFYTTKKSGMGIGLSLCRSIITAHGGKLTFERNQNRGTTFRFTLPVAIGADS